jgi:hypothetical protein
MNNKYLYLTVFIIKTFYVNNIIIPMNVDEDILLKYINKLPTDLVRYTKAYLPNSLVRKVRRIHKHELPSTYRVCKDLNVFFYKKYIGYDIDIKNLQINIHHLKNKQIHNKRNIVNPLSLTFWRDPFTNDSYIRNEIGKKEKRIETFGIFMDYYFHCYFQSTIHLYKFKIVEF